MICLKASYCSSAIYVCPYTDCGHIADADLQASLAIALRGFIAATVDRENPQWRGKTTKTVSDQRAAAQAAMLRATREQA